MNILNPPYLAVLLSLISASSDAMKAMVFQVGQGNCTVIKHPTRKDMLIDAGSAKLPLHVTKINIIENITRYILSTKPTHLTIVVSHSHQDHYGWIPEIANKIIKKQIAVSLLLGGTASDYKTAAYNKLNELKRNIMGVCIDEIAPKDLEKLLPGYCTVLAALTSGPAYNPNCRSIVLYIKELNLLVPGDATGTTTDHILKNYPHLKAAILLVPHHGSNSEKSNNTTFLKSLDAQKYIISAGEKHDHPHGQVIQRILSCLNKKNAVPLHSVTYHPKETNLNTERFKSVLVYSNGYITAVTDYALYTTLDTGDIHLTLDGNDTVLLESPLSPIRVISMQDCLVKTINQQPLEALTKIDITECSLEDSNIKDVEKLPETLKEFILDRNKLTPEGIHYLLSILTNREHTLMLSIKDLGFLVSHFEWILKNDKKIAPLLRKWLFFCVIEQTNKSPATIPLQRLSFSKGIQRENPSQDIYVPAYVVPCQIQDKNCYLLKSCYDKKTYIDALKALKCIT